MAKKSAPRRKPKRALKVFEARLGFYDMVVAVPGKAAALRAWDVHQDLFAQGAAWPATDEAAIWQAREHPGIPLVRPAGSDAPYALRPGKLPGLPESEAAPPEKHAGKAKPDRTARAAQAKTKAKTKAQPEPDRRALDRAEAALRKLESARAKEEEALKTEQADLDERRAAALAAYMQAARKAKEEIARARRQYRKAGGED